MSIKAILAGTVFDFIGTFLVSVVLEVLMVLLFHVPLTDVNTNNPTNVALVLNLVVGLAGDFGGGTAAALLLIVPAASAGGTYAAAPTTRRR